MALPAGMGLSAAARAAGFDFQMHKSSPKTTLLSPSPPLPPPPPLPDEQNDDNNSRQSMDESSDDPEEDLLGALAALGSSPLPRQQQHQQHQQQQQLLLQQQQRQQQQRQQQQRQQQQQQRQQQQRQQQQQEQQAAHRVGVGVGAGGAGGDDGDDDDDDAAAIAGSVAAAAAAAAAAMAAANNNNRRELPRELPRPAVQPRIHRVTSPPPPKPATSVAAAIHALQAREVGALPLRREGLRAIVGGKRGRSVLRASSAISEEVAKRFPRQAKQAARLSAVEDKLDTKINAVRRRLLAKVEGVEWTTALMRCWLTLEVVCGAEKYRKEGRAESPGSGDNKGQQQQHQEDWFVLVRLQGTLVNPPMDGVERRLTSAFSKIALKLDPYAFPEVQAVEWARSPGCEDLHGVELRLPLSGPLSMGLKQFTVQAFLHSRMDDDRPRRFVLSSPLRQALRLAKQVDTKTVLLAAVCEALRHRGLMPTGGERILVSCDEQLQALFGRTAFPFHKLEEALGPHVQPADPPVLAATVSLAEGGKAERQLDVKIDTEAPFQLQAVRALLGGGGVVGGEEGGEEKREGAGENKAEEQQGEGQGSDDRVGDRPLGMPTAAEIDARTKLDGQIALLVEAVNTSGKRAAMLRELSEDPMTVVPRLETQMLAHQQTLAAEAGITQLPPWRDYAVCEQVTVARAEAGREESIRQAREAKRRASLLNAYREDAAMRVAQQHAKADAESTERELQQQQQQQRVMLREAQRAISEERERKWRQQQQQQQLLRQQQQRQATLQTQRQQQQTQQHAQTLAAQAAAAAEEASRLGQNQGVAGGGTAGAIGNEQDALSVGGHQPDGEPLRRMRLLFQQRQLQPPAQQKQALRQDMLGQGQNTQEQQQQQPQRFPSPAPSRSPHLSANPHTQQSPSYSAESSRSVAAPGRQQLPPLQARQESLHQLRDLASSADGTGRSTPVGRAFLGGGQGQLHSQQQQQNPGSALSASIQQQQQKQPLATTAEIRRPLSRSQSPLGVQPQLQRQQQQLYSRSAVQGGLPEEIPSAGEVERHTSEGTQDQLARTLLSQNDDGDEESVLPPPSDISDHSQTHPSAGRGGVGGRQQQQREHLPRHEPQEQEHQLPHRGVTTAPTTSAAGHPREHDQATVMHGEWARLRRDRIHPQHVHEVASQAQHRGGGSGSSSGGGSSSSSSSSSNNSNTTATTTTTTTTIGVVGGVVPAVHLKSAHISRVMPPSQAFGMGAIGVRGGWRGGRDEESGSGRQDGDNTPVVGRSFELHGHVGSQDGAREKGGGNERDIVAGPRYNAGNPEGLAAVGPALEAGVGEQVVGAGPGQNTQLRHELEEQQRQQQQQRGQFASEYSGWQSQTERKRQGPQ